MVKINGIEREIDWEEITKLGKRILKTSLITSTVFLAFAAGTASVLYAPEIKQFCNQLIHSSKQTQVSYEKQRLSGREIKFSIPQYSKIRNPQELQNKIEEENIIAEEKPVKIEQEQEIYLGQKPYQKKSKEKYPQPKKSKEKYFSYVDMETYNIKILVNGEVVKDTSFTDTDSLEFIVGEKKVINPDTDNLSQNKLERLRQ